LVFYRSSRTKAGIFLHLGVVLSCYSRFEPCFRTRSEENPVRIPHADASSSLVSDKCGYLYQRQIPGYAPDVSLRLGHLRGKTILNRFLTLSGRFASRCGSVTFEGKRCSIVFLHSQAALLLAALPEANASGLWFFIGPREQKRGYFCIRGCSELRLCRTWGMSVHLTVFLRKLFALIIAIIKYICYNISVIQFFETEICYEKSIAFYFDSTDIASCYLRRICRCE